MKKLKSLFLILASLYCISGNAGIERQTIKENIINHIQSEDEDNQLINIENLNIQKNIPYSLKNMNNIDIYQNKNNVNGFSIVMVHGGGWKNGDKSNPNVINNKINKWTQQGFTFISVNYEMLPNSSVDDQVKQVAKAVSYIQNNGSKYGIDKNKVILMGHSAGAHLVSLLSVSNNLLKENNISNILGVISLDSAAYNVNTIMLNPHFKLYDEAFGVDINYWTRMSPILAIKEKSFPFLLVCSVNREVSCNQAELFSQKLKIMGGYSEIIKVDLTHAEINKKLGLESNYTTKVDDFIKKLVSIAR